MTRHTAQDHRQSAIGKTLGVWRLTFFFAFIVCANFLFAYSVGAQPTHPSGGDNAVSDDEPPKDAAPPPLKIISKDERRTLEAETNSKKRTQLSLELLEARLKLAEQLAAQGKFQETINELGGFQGLLENVLKYLESKDDGGSKSDNNYKRLEIGLRKTVARLELVRRELPFKYGYYVQRLQKFVREARAKAVEPLFGDSVVPQQ